VDAYLKSGLDALADDTRMAIFDRLSRGSMAVNELASIMPVSRPAVSQHLRVLKDAGLVLDSRQGTRRIYQLSPEGIARLRDHFDEIWTRALGSFETAASQTNAPPENPTRTAKKGASHHASNRRTGNRP
jgi:DNA-binding transcriptional ArsR family regulator